MLALKIVTIIGFLLSIYSYYIEKKSEKNKDYKAICDLSENMSCNKAFTSEYGKTAGISNSIFGIIFYILIFILIQYNYLSYVFYLAIASVLGSIYLAYISYFKLKNFCLVCTSIYVVNILLLIFSYQLVF